MIGITELPKYVDGNQVDLIRVREVTLLKIAEARVSLENTKIKTLNKPRDKNIH